MVQGLFLQLQTKRANFITTHLTWAAIYYHGHLVHQSMVALILSVEEYKRIPWSSCGSNNTPDVCSKKYASKLSHIVYPTVVLPCTAMHIRRGYSGLPRFPFRRYAAVSEHLLAGNVLENETIVLLTDDASPI